MVGNDFCDFLFAALIKKLSVNGSCLGGKNLLLGEAVMKMAELLPLKVYPFTLKNTTLSMVVNVIFSSPEPKAQGELLPSANVRCASSTIASNDISSETARPRTLIFGM